MALEIRRESVSLVPVENIGLVWLCFDAELFTLSKGEGPDPASRLPGNRITDGTDGSARA